MRSHSPHLIPVIVLAGYTSASFATGVKGAFLEWEHPDLETHYVDFFSTPQVTFSQPLGYMGALVTSQSNPALGPTLFSPHPDVLAAWNQGWTGEQTNILLVDHYTGSGVDFTHGVTTMMITDLTAPGANKFGLHYGTQGNKPSDLLKDGEGAAVEIMQKMDVVNASFGFNYWANDLNPAVASDREKAFSMVTKSAGAKIWKKVFSGALKVKNLAVDNAVIVKAAGNDSTDSAYEPYLSAFASNESIYPRLLIVGATRADGSTSSPTALASYSNKAGSDDLILARFLVANGNTPYDSKGVKVDKRPLNAGVGTSFAAPRVAGYAAILKQKFNNLGPVQTSQILLDTARYDTLTCYPACDPHIYGKGEASLSNALAPVGPLK